MLLGIAITALVGLPAQAQDGKRGDDSPREEVEPFYGDAAQSIAIEVPRFRGIAPALSLRYRSSRRDALLGVGWTLHGYSTIQAASPRRGIPRYDGGDIFLLDGRELLPCDAAMVSPSCATGGTHATQIESYRRIKLNQVDNTWEIWSPDGTKTTLVAVEGQAGPPPTTITPLLEAHFDAGAEGFVYSDGLFGGSDPQTYATGTWDNDERGLRLSLGGIDPVDHRDMSGGWTQSFTVPSAMRVSLSFTYSMVLSSEYEADEYSHVLMSFDGDTPVVVAELVGDGNGGSSASTGTQTHTADLGLLAPGTYTFAIGGYNNLKTYTNESTTIEIDDIAVIGEEEGSAYEFATTYRWAVSEVTDSRGNTVNYRYFNDAGAAYLETITYNGTEIRLFWQGRSDSYTRTIGVETAIETHLRLNAIDVQTGGQRVRAYALAYNPPLATTEKGLLASVQMYGKDAVLDSDGTVTSGTSLPPTTLTYYDSPPSFAETATWSTAHSGTAYKEESVQYADVNGDNLADRIFRTTDNKIEVSLSDGTQFAPPTQWAHPGGTYKSNQDSYADVDGDGMADLVFRKSDNRIGVYISDGASFSAPTSWIAMGGSYYNGQLNVGDVNGDGAADLVFVKVTRSCSIYYRMDQWECELCDPGDVRLDCTQVTVQSGRDNDRLEWRAKCQHCTFRETLYLGLSDGVGFTAPVLQFNLTGATASTTFHADRVKLADLNGDGRADLSYRANGNVIKVALSDGDAFATLANWHNFGGTYQAGQLQYADVNGDGAADALFHPIAAGCSQYTRTDRQHYPGCNLGDIAIEQYSRQVQSGRDNDHIEYVTVCEHCSPSGSQVIKVLLSNGSDFLEPATWFTGLPANAEPDLVKFADFDGDGRADLSYRNGDNAVTIALSTGSQFTTLTTLPAFHGGYKPAQIQLADVNGDGKDDVIHRATNQTINVALAGPVGVPSHGLATVTNIHGGVLTYTYLPSSSWSNNHLPFVVHTVASVTADDGRGHLATTEYAYSGGLWDMSQRRFFGFRTATATLPCLAGEAECPTVKTTFLQHPGAYGKVGEVERYDGGGAVLTRVEQAYALSGEVLPYTSLNIATTRTIYDGGQSRRTKTARVFDAYANLIEEISYGDFDQTGDELTTITDFFPNTSSYLVSLPARVRQFAGAGTAGAMLSESLHHYDGATATTTPPTLGNLTTVKGWDDNTSSYSVSTIEYDHIGNIVATVDALGRRSEIDYDSAYNQFPIGMRHPPYFAGDTRHVTSTVWDEACNVPLSKTDPNGQSTTHVYDPLCRLIRTDTPANHFSIISYYNQGDPQSQYVQTAIPSADDSGEIWARSYVDGWGRTVRDVAKGASAGHDIIVDTEYNLRGAKASVTHPHYPGSPVYTTIFAYDAGDRPIETLHPDLNRVRTTYGLGIGFMSETTTDELGHAVTMHYDAYGRMVGKDRASASGTIRETYTWDLLGRLTSVTDDAGNTWTYTYDSLGRRIMVDDPDRGIRNYAYDAAGQLLAKSDAKGQTTQFTYDSLGRVLSKTVWNAAAAQYDVTSYTYDEEGNGYANIGRQTTVENAVGRIEYNYDADGNLLETMYVIDGNRYAFGTGFDLAGRPLWFSYPDGDSVGSAVDPITYDSAGRTAAIPGISSHTEYDPHGRVEAVTLANGVTTAYAYSPERGWLESLHTSTGATVIHDFVYERHADGQISAITSSHFGESWSYGYDDLKRLIWASNTDEPLHDQTYEYDTVGNLIFKSNIGGYSYPTPGSARPHAVIAAGGHSYHYDNNGNMIEGGGRTLVWDGDDRPSQINDVLFFYGPDGARWKKVNTTTGNVTLTLGRIEIQDAGTADEVMVKYLPGGARRAGGDTLWLHKNHLNSLQAATDASGTVVFRRVQMPYGARVSELSFSASEAGVYEAGDFIGERLDEETGLLFLHARYYDPVLGRFLSADPLDPIEAGVGVNRFAYAGNNPIHRIDPKGTSWLSDVIDSIDNALSDFLGVDRALRDYHRDLNRGNGNVSWHTVEKAAKAAGYDGGGTYMGEGRISVPGRDLSNARHSQLADLGGQVADALAGELVFELNPFLVDLMKEFLGFEFDGAGISGGVAISWPGSSGGEFDIGLIGTVYADVGGAGVPFGSDPFGKAMGNLKKYASIGKFGIELTAGHDVPSVRDFSGRGIDVGFHGLGAGFTVGLDYETNEWESTSLTLGPGFSVGAEFTQTGTLTARDLVGFISDIFQD